MVPPEGEAPAEQKVAEVPERIMSHWGRTDPFFLDAEAVDHGVVPTPAPGALARLADEATTTGFNFVPVTGLERSEEYQEATRHAIETLSSGCGFRITVPQLTDDRFEASLNGLLERLGISRHESHLFLDYKYIPEGQHSTFALAFSSQASQFPALGEWDTFTVLGASYPETLSDVMGNHDQQEFTREEWLLYIELWSDRDSLPRVPAFGDYGTIHPSMEMDKAEIPGGIRIVPKIKYTTDEGVFTVRAEHLEGAENNQQYFDLAGRVVESDAFEGDDYYADQYLRQKVERRETGPGNATTWVGVGMSRHLEKVAHQIASLPGT